jgi:hypothetical protein
MANAHISRYRLPRMTKSDWIAIAEALKLARESAGLPPDLGADAHDRKLIYYATLQATDRISVLLAAVIKSHSTRFDEERFLRLIGVHERPIDTP